MEYTNSKTVSFLEYETTYGHDSINIHDELVNEFKINNTNALISVTAGELVESDNGFTYNITIEYDNN